MVDSKQFLIESLTDADLDLLAEQAITSFDFICGEENFVMFYTLVLTQEGTIDLLGGSIDYYTGYGQDAVECSLDAEDIAGGKKWIINCLLESISCFDN